MKNIKLTCKQANELANKSELEIVIDGEIHKLRYCSDYKKVKYYGGWSHLVEFVVVDSTGQFYISASDMTVGNNEYQHEDAFYTDIILQPVKRVKKMIEIEDWEYI